MKSRKIRGEESMMNLATKRRGIGIYNLTLSCLGNQ